MRSTPAKRFSIKYHEMVLVVSETISSDNEDWDLLDDQEIEVWVSNGWEQGIKDLKDELVLQNVSLIIVDSRLFEIQASYDWVYQQIRERAIPYGQINLFLFEFFTDQLDLFAGQGMTQNSTWENLAQRIPSLLLQYCGSR